MKEKGTLWSMKEKGTLWSMKEKGTLWSMKEKGTLWSMKEILYQQNSVISCQVSPCFATRCLLVTARELWWMNQE
jgi:hypothetical protein